MRKEETYFLDSNTDIKNDCIRERAYEIWERHHRPEGFEAHFWLLAIRELLTEQETIIAKNSKLNIIIGDHYRLSRSNI